MADTNPRRIDLKGCCRHEEFIASAALLPGYLVKQISTAVNAQGNGEIAKHATSGGPAEFMVAKEDRLRGKTINDAYAQGDPVPCAVLAPGDVAYCRVAAAATALVPGDFVMSNGDGCVAKRTSTNTILGVVVEHLDNSAGGAEAFAKIRRI